MVAYTFDFAAVLVYWPLLLEGVVLTVKLSAIATVFGLLAGTVCAIASARGPAWARSIIAAYVEVVRNTPLLVQIFIVFFGLASLGLKLSAFFAACLGLVVNIAAYTSEIVRAGIESIPKGQIEAASALGLRDWQTMSLVVLPQAVANVYPSLSSQYVLLMLASSITSQISAEELTAVGNRIQSDTFRSFEIYIVIGVLYFALSLATRSGFWLLGRGLLASKASR